MRRIICWLFGHKMEHYPKAWISQCSRCGYGYNWDGAQDGSR